jgi:hypothetical protein
MALSYVLKTVGISYFVDMPRLTYGVVLKENANAKQDKLQVFQ